MVRTTKWDKGTYRIAGKTKCGGKHIDDLICVFCNDKIQKNDKMICLRSLTKKSKHAHKACYEEARTEAKKKEREP